MSRPHGPVFFLPQRCWVLFPHPHAHGLQMETTIFLAYQLLWTAVGILQKALLSPLFFFHGSRLCIPPA